MSSFSSRLYLQFWMLHIWVTADEYQPASWLPGTPPPMSKSILWSLRESILIYFLSETCQHGQQDKSLYVALSHSTGGLSSSLGAICRTHRGLLPSGDSGGMRRHYVIQEELRLSGMPAQAPNKVFPRPKLNTRLYRWTILCRVNKQH